MREGGIERGAALVRASASGGRVRACALLPGFRVSGWEGVMGMTPND